MMRRSEPLTLVQWLGQLRGVHTGDVIDLRGEAGRPGEVLVVLVAETPGFLGTGLLVRPPPGTGGPFVSYDDRRALGLQLGGMLRRTCGNIPAMPAFTPAGGVLQPDGHLVHFAAGPDQRGVFF